MVRAAIEVPFDREGVLMHYARPGARPGTFGAAHKWLEPKPIELALHLVNLQRGQSAAYFVFADELLRTWPMFMKDLLEMIKQTTLVQGYITGTFIPCKRGQNYGLRYVGPEERS